MEALRENLNCWWLCAVLAVPWFPAQHSNLCLCLHMVFFLYKDNVIGLGFILIQEGLTWRSLIKSTKTLLPNEGTFTGSG